MLNRIYEIAMVGAALLLATIGILVTVQITLRLFGYVFPYAELAQYAMSGAIFLALAQTLRTGGHIQVTLVIERLPESVRRHLDRVLCAFGALIIGYASYFVVLNCWESFKFGRVATGMIALPLWIPQGVMSLGMVLFTVSLLERAILANRDEKDQSAEGAV
ncbi:MAG: TRAP transporter small permease [Rhizobiaceae bacterium]|nr:TRAP transporter small permease [Rhizobiaceae bacterium]